MNPEQPLVSCIMPTYNRREFVPHAIRYFLRQQYARKELIIIDDGTDAIKDLVPDDPSIRYFYLDKKINLGAKLNQACAYARGSIIANWDDDDWYSPARLQYQVDALQQPGTDVCGINRLLYFDLRDKKAWQYIYPANQRKWLLGSSLCYTKQLWSSIGYAEIDIGMDGLFVWNTPPDRVKVLADNSFSVHMIHNANVSPKNTSGGWWHPYPAGELKKIMQHDWVHYEHTGAAATPENDRETGIDMPLSADTCRKFQNVHACLVHESKACIADLIQNLHYHDPESVILLYNGSGDPDLLNGIAGIDDCKVIIVPGAIPAKHGYLHHFALHCMQFALKTLSFDTITIVDSDQLAVQSGYSAFLSEFLASRPDIGLLSSMPERVTPNHTNCPVARQALREFDLWKPFLESFPGGKDHFVYWTFWPSTVFTAPAVKDLVRLFAENRQLQHIMQHTKIWATEEVIFPTLVKLLGYEIALNPCSYDYVRYRTAYSPQEITLALNKPDAYWIHPVERRYDNPLRKYTRQRFNGYAAATGTLVAGIKNAPDVSARSLVNTIRSIPGWLSDREAYLLTDITKKACNGLPAPHNIVETGSFQGKSTVLFGNIVKALYPGSTVFAIDPHDGRAGAEDTGLQTFPPTWEAFNSNIISHGLTDVVEMIRSRVCDGPWDKPVSLLFVDGLHDYKNVSGDFLHFSSWLVPGGYVAFHDYAPYFPGVMAFADELLETGTYREVQKEQSLVVVQKL